MEKNIRTLSRRQRAPQQSSFFFLPGGAVPLLYLLLLLFIFFPFLSQCPFFPLYTKWRHIRSSPPHDRRALPGAHNNNDDDDNSFSVFPADFPLLLLQTILIRFHSNNLTTSLCWVRWRLYIITIHSSLFYEIHKKKKMVGGEEIPFIMKR